MTKGYNVKVALKTASFSSVSLETLDTGVTLLSITRGQDIMSVPLLPEEFGILLTSFGNAITEGRLEEKRRLEERTLMYERRKRKDN